MPLLPWVYVYSQRYSPFHYMLQDSLQSSKFESRPIFIDQSEFEKVTYKPGAGHFLCGCYIKQENLLKELKKMPLYSYMVFSDIDIALLKPDVLFDHLKVYMDRGVDMAFMWEGMNNPNPLFNVNIGFSLIRASPQVIEFFEKVIEHAKKNPDLLDTAFMLAFFESFPGKIDVFDRKVICLSNYYPETEPKEMIALIQILCGNHSDFRLNMNEKFMGAKYFGFPIEKYLYMAIQNGVSPETLGIKI